ANLDDMHNTCCPLRSIGDHRPLIQVLHDVKVFTETSSLLYITYKTRDEIDHFPLIALSFSVSSALATLGSALPLLRFMTSPINMETIPFFPLLYSSTFKGNSRITSSIIGIIAL